MFGVELDRQVIPAELEAIPPGVVLAAYLSKVDRSRVNGHDLVIVMKAEARMEAHYAAQKMATITEAAYCPPGDFASPAARSDRLAEFASDDLSAALNLTRQSADSELGFSLELRERLPRVWEMLDAGMIDVRRARTIVRGTLHLSENVAQQVVERVIDTAPRLTTGQLAARIRRLCVEADPEEAKKLYKEALKERRVVSEANPDGTADLLGTQLPPDRVGAITRYLDKTARGLKAAGDSRTMDQLRSDIYLDLLQGKHRVAGRDRAVVDIQVDLETLMGLSESPGEIPGYGPVIADIARQVAAEQDQAQWRYTVTSNGQPVSNGTTSRRPAASQRREVEARNPTCVFPGCRMPARNCDLDHRRAWADGGHTTIKNLEPLCRHHHRVKHKAGWDLQRHPNGSYIWISRLGHRYTTTGGRPP